MNGGGARSGSVEPVVRSTPLVTAERRTDVRDGGAVATFEVTTDNERPVAVRIGQDLPTVPLAERGFHPARAPRAWSTENGRVVFKDTVGPSTNAVLEFGMTFDGTRWRRSALPEFEIERAEPVGVAPDADGVVFTPRQPPEPAGRTGAGAGSDDGGLLSGVRAAVFGTDEDEPVARAADLNPDAMVVTSDRDAQEDAETGSVSDRGDRVTDLQTEVEALRDEVVHLREDLEVAHGAPDSLGARVEALQRSVDDLLADARRPNGTGPPDE